MDIEILSLFENRVLHFVPALNPDTIEFLNSYHLKTGHTKMLYKNRRADKITSLAECGESGIGVNLNRNFPIGFDFNP
jgi:murein tripeptide amidase MpaA